MARDRDDEFLMTALEESQKRVAALDISDGTRPWVDTANELLQSASQAFKELVEREDLEELEARQALQVMREAKRTLDKTFHEVIANLDIVLGKSRLAPDANREQQMALAHFISRFHQGEFESLRTRAAVKTADEALGFLQEYEPSSQAASALEAAIDALESAREAAGDEGAEAVEAYGELVEGRSVARVCYLTARDLVSASLRFEARHEELDTIIPPISDILKVGFN
jgi:hypothetical protein